jgi:hypothetical protein
MGQPFFKKPFLTRTNTRTKTKPSEPEESFGGWVLETGNRTIL